MKADRNELIPSLMKSWMQFSLNGYEENPMNKRKEEVTL